ncbi:MAG: ribosome small subunit-dependent GTPase A [Bacillota bacterium]
MSRRVEGIIVKAYGGFYFVSDNRNTWRCTLRGVFKHRKIDVLVGDRVAAVVDEFGGGVVEEVYPRRNALIRPPVANVDRAVIVFAVMEPDPSALLLDRFLVHVRCEDIEPVICINKMDLWRGKAVEIYDVYTSAGYRVILTSTVDKTGIEDLRRVLEKGVSVFAGPSGVGKSSLLNAVKPGLSLKTGEVGGKLKRGRHTTRNVELLFLGQDGLVADTPGFTSLYLPEIKKEDLAMYFPDMENYIYSCRFNGCIHWTEPDCAVKTAVDKNMIDRGRYARYLEILKEVMERERIHR